MERKFLEDLKLEKEIIDKVMAENGKDIEAQKAIVTVKEAETAALKTQLADRDKDLSELKKVDAAGLQTQLTALQSKYDTETKALSGKLAQQAKDNKIDLALTAAKAKNVKAARALLDLEKISLDGENLLGFTEQMEQMAKDAPYLFDAVSQNPPPPAAGATLKTTPKTLQDAVSSALEAQQKG